MGNENVTMYFMTIKYNMVQGRKSPSSGNQPSLMVHADIAEGRACMVLHSIVLNAYQDMLSVSAKLDGIYAFEYSLR